MIKLDVCPFCGSKQVARCNDEVYYCGECNRAFTEEELEFEQVRQNVSAILSGMYVTEVNYINCTRYGDLLTIGDDEAQGLSELEKPTITRIYQDQECIIWVKIDGDFGDTEFDDLSLTDAQAVLEWLQNNINR